MAQTQVTEATAEAPRTPTERQRRYILRTGQRFGLGYDGKVTQRVVVIDVYPDWLEFHFEDDSGNYVNPAIGVKIDVFRSSIIEEYPPLSTRECEARGYR